MLVLFRASIGAAVLGPVAALGLGLGNVVAFDSRAAALERSWAAAEVGGVGHDRLAPARASLQGLRAQRVGFLPYSFFSGALFVDPFGTPERLAAGAQAQALAAARQRARAALARLQDVGGPNYTGLDAHRAELAAARELPDVIRLLKAWEAEAAQLAEAREALSAASGGLSGGLPKDVVDGVARLQSVVSAASQAQLSTEPAAQALARAQDYLKLPYPRLLEQHAAVAGEVRAAGDAVQHRIDTRALAAGLAGRLPDLLAQAAKYGITGSYPARAAQARADVEAAVASGDDAAVDRATAALKEVVDELGAAVATARKRAAAAAMASGTGCIEGAPAKLIVVHLATQKLVAYDNGCPFLTTLVTTGRPELPTGRGTFQIFAKYPVYQMISPWPEGSPYYYKPTTVYNAMEFISDGTYLHSADWQPAGTYGPGSQYGPYASHGCVHVQDGPLATLYGWAPIGTTVIVTD